MAYFTMDKWHQISGHAVGEIALNPSLFAEHSWLSLMKAIAQQQCHIWQHMHGTPGRPGYHNSEWSGKMKEIGLLPTATGELGGRSTGQRVVIRIMPNGQFIRACIKFVESYPKMPVSSRWHFQSINDDSSDIFPPNQLPETVARLTSPIGEWSDDPELIENENLKEKKKKLKYTCGECDTNVWGKSGLKLLCAECHTELREVPPGVKMTTKRRMTKTG